MPRKTGSSRAQLAYLAVRQQIVSGAIAPGEFVRERSTAARLDVSRTPLREAFGRLATEGFLERVPNRGFRASRTPVRDLLDLYPIVTALELLAATESLPRLVPADVAALRRHDEAMRDAARSGDAPGAIRANERFHQQLLVHCTNARLMRMLDELRLQLVGLELWSASVEDLNVQAFAHHEAIVNAVELGNHELAARVLEANRMQTCTALRQRG